MGAVVNDITSQRARPQSLWEHEAIHVIGLSGGKDSTALALYMSEAEPRDYTYLFTPTGHELPEMTAWLEYLEELLGKKITRFTNKDRTLTDLIQIHNRLPNPWQRWCTRQLKIEPTIAWCVRNAPATLYVGLRADEEEREGIYGDLVRSEFPFRRLGWGIDEVWGYLQRRGVADLVPIRTDCYDCYDQQIREWWALWKYHPDLYEKACLEEDRTGGTFRSEGRDTWPAGLRLMAAEFEKGRKIRGGVEPKRSCRVCSL
jgi:hypothetical protein